MAHFLKKNKKNGNLAFSMAQELYFTIVESL